MLEKFIWNSNIFGLFKETTENLENEITLQDRIWETLNKMQQMWLANVERKPNNMEQVMDIEKLITFNLLNEEVEKAG